MKDDLGKNENSNLDVDTALASTLYLLTRYGESGEDSLAVPIAQHLKMLEEVEGFDAPLLKQTCRRLRSYWLNKLCKNAATGAVICDKEYAGIAHPELENSNDCDSNESEEALGLTGEQIFSNIH